MLYQLPSGKVINISIEEYLGMSDQDFHEITNSGIGDDPYYNHSFADKSSRRKPVEDDEEYISNDIDYTPEDDETNITGPIDFESLEEQ